MSVLAPAKHITEQSKVHFSQYISSEDAPKETDEKPADQPTNPGQPEAS